MGAEFDTDIQNCAKNDTKNEIHAPGVSAHARFTRRLGLSTYFRFYSSRAHSNFQRAAQTVRKPRTRTLMRVCVDRKTIKIYRKGIFLQVTLKFPLTYTNIDLGFRRFYEWSTKSFCFLFLYGGFVVCSYNCGTNCCPTIHIVTTGPSEMR